MELPEGQRWASDPIDGLAEQTVTAAALAERLSPDAAQINLIPTMPLHVGFRFGARLGYTHAREVVVHSIRQADGAPAYFPAVALRAQDAEGSRPDRGAPRIRSPAANRPAPPSRSTCRVAVTSSSIRGLASEGGDAPLAAE